MAVINPIDKALAFYPTRRTGCTCCSKALTVLPVTRCTILALPRYTTNGGHLG
jgi:hypothetical protein